MEWKINNKKVLEQIQAPSLNGSGKVSTAKPFIEANTIPVSVKEIRDEHIIPVWATSNEPLISHSEFVESTWEMTHRMFANETIMKPNIRVSHAIKGRIPEAKHKAAKDLQPHEQTLYYERMMFVIEIPSVYDTVNGNSLSLTIGGVKSYNLDNLYSKRGSADQHFQLFVGFQNTVCCNLCIWSDGIAEEVGISSTGQLMYAVENLINRYKAGKHLKAMRNMIDIELTETEFAQVVGRCRMFKHLPDNTRKDMPEILLGDQQLGAVVHDYYKDFNFGTEHGGSISVWQFYNLLTGANKSSYIDSFIERGVNANDFSNGIIKHKLQSEPFWYMG